MQFFWRWGLPLLRLGVRRSGWIGLSVLSFWITGCTGLTTKEERLARQEQRVVEGLYRPEGKPPEISSLSEESGLGDFLKFAMLNQPRVEAAYQEWNASIEEITKSRSLPDPRLTFESDIQTMILSLMPGLMIDLPSPGKLASRARISSAASISRYFAFEISVLEAAFQVKKIYYQLRMLDEKIRIHRETLRLLVDFERIALAQNAVGKVTLQDVIRAQIEQERVSTEIVNLEDSRNPLMAQWKAALGLSADHSNPPIPKGFESSTLELSEGKLWETALRRNPRLRSMEAEVRQAEAAIDLAHKAAVPDGEVGIKVDVKASPLLWTPQLGISLPIWRDKIAAEIQRAQALKHGADARLSAEQIGLAVQLAERLLVYRESQRNLELLHDRLLLKATQSLEVARSGYLSGRIDFFNLIDAEKTLLEFQLAEVEARIQRELALAELSLIVVGVAPTDAPLLPQTEPSSRETDPASNSDL